MPVALGTLLVISAAAKAADVMGTRVALAGWGVPGGLVTVALWLLVALELVVGAALLAGVEGALWIGAALFAVFAVAQAVALALGRGGAPCGCLGGRGQITPRSALIAGALAVAAAAAALMSDGGAATALNPAAGVAAAVVLFAAVAIRMRGRSVADGPLDVTGEGPEIGTAAPPELQLGSGLRLLVFTSEGCRLCTGLRPQVERMGGIDVHFLDEVADAGAWRAGNVPGAPFAVVLDPTGVVRAKGTVNARRHVEALVEAAASAPWAESTATVLVDSAQGDGGGAPRARWAESTATMRVDSAQGGGGGAADRRAFLARAGGTVAALTAGRTVGSLIKPGEAEAYHFCGHIYTTDGCPHPTGLPRIDSKGFPLRAKDGHRVDDLGRLVALDGTPVDEDGEPLVDADGVALPPATRTRVCVAAGKTYRQNVRTDGAWYRCCGGHVRKLVDCCTTGSRRINGDRGLTGYCYKGRKVFCVMYYQSKVPC